MKIVEVRPIAIAVAVPPPHKGGYHWVFVKLTTDTGVVGKGYGRGGRGLGGNAP